jgi:hypothetical protein
MTPLDPLPAALDQLAAHREHIAQLDEREATHFAALSGRLTQIADLLTTISGTANDHAAALARLDGLDRQVAELAAHIAGTVAADGGPDGYRPGPAPRWWKLTGQPRQDAIGRLRAWVEQVYRPGYGQLAATLGPCWEAHDLCLYALDIAAELWSVLYLQSSRTPALLSAQAEYQTRILPALAEQLMTETSRCGHAQARRPLNGRARSTP